MVYMQKLALAGTVLLGLTSAASSSSFSSSSSSTTKKVRAADSSNLRLIKTFEDDVGTWMTEEEKFDQLISKKVGFMDITDTMELEARRLARTTTNKPLNTTTTLPNSGHRRQSSSFPSGPFHQSEASPLVSSVSQSNMESWVSDMAAFYNRHYRGDYAAESSRWMYDAATSAASGNSDITVETFEHAGYDQPSIIVKIPSSGDGGVVIVSAHFDSVGSTAGGEAPGADDNASGVAVLLEALRVLSSSTFAPSTNSLEFHFYSGEEGGMLGSRSVMESYSSSSPPIPVLALMNQDMTGYSPNNVIAVYTDYVDAELTDFIGTLVPVYTGLELAEDECGYGCSDHASATDAGYPAAYVCDEVMRDSSPYIHSADDTVDTISFEHMVEHAKLTVGFLVEGSYF